jgi:DNA processing protein
MNALDRTVAASATELAAVRPAGDGLEARDVAAAAILGFVSEPGDGVLGRLVSALGAAQVAEDLLAERASAELTADAADRGAAVSVHEVAAGLQRWRPRLDHAAFARGLRQAARVGARLLLPADAEWPDGVRDLDAHSPLTLWVRGRVGALDETPSVALVGARAATAYGEHVAIETAAGLVDRGFAVVSGGAYGIDGTAHRSALAGGGTTVAFLAGGVDRFYPVGHEALLSRIAETGAVVSEMSCGAAPTRWRFLQRNRLIAAASQATVVLEAGMRSGSLNTAGHAAALGRPLGAVPGPVTSPASAGCHRLLREFDAICVTDAAQVAELVLPADAPSDPTAPRGARAGTEDRALDLAPEERRVLDALGLRRSRTVAELAERAGLDTSAVLGALGALDATGLARRVEDGWVRRRSA